MLIAFAVTALPMVLMTIIAAAIAKQGMENTVFEKNRILAETIAGKVDQSIREKMRVLKIAANSADIRSMNPVREVPALSDIATQYPQGMPLIIVCDAASGKQVARSDGRDLGIRNDDRDYFRKVITTGTTAISDVINAKSTGRLSIIIAEPINGKDRTVRGVLIGVVDLQRLDDLIAQTKIGDTGYAYAVNKNGKILIHKDRSLVQKMTDFSSLAPVKAVITGQTGWVRYELDGRKKLAGYSYAPVTQWGIIAEQPLDEAMAGVTRIEKYNTIIMTCAVLFDVFVAFVLAGLLSKPILKLTAAAGKVADGDLTVEAETDSSDEIGALAYAFNNMTTQIRKRDEDLRESEEQYRSLVNNINIGIFRATASGDRYIQVNPALANMHGSDSVVELLKVQVKDVWQHSEDRKDFVRELKRNGYVRNKEVVLLKKDGTPRWCSLTATAQYDENGIIKWIDGIVEDITERKKSEAALRESEEQYRSLVNNINIGIFRTPGIGGRFIQANQAMANIFGLDSVDEVLTMKVKWGYQNPEQREDVLDEIRRNGYVRNKELPFRKRDGTKYGAPIWCSVTATAQYDEHADVKWIDGIVEDITERKKSEAAIRESEEKYRTLVNNINIGIFRNPAGDGRFIQANPALANILGYDSVEELLKLQVKEAYQHPEHRKDFIDEIKLSGYVRNKELALKKKDGTPIFCSLTATAQYDENGHLKWLDGIVEDITERKKAEAAIYQLAAIVDNSSEGIVIYDDSGVVVNANKQACLMYETDRDELIGQHIILFESEKDRSISTERMQQLRQGETLLYERRYHRKDGRYCFIEISAKAMKIDQKMLIQSFHRDITERKKMQAQLIHAQKMESIGTLAGGIAHDFGNILTSIRLYADLVSSSNNLPSDIAQYARIIESAAEQGKHVVTQLLSYAKREYKNFVQVSMNNVIEKTITLVSRLIPKNITIHQNLDESLTPVDGDESKLEQVVMNLLLNAKDAMPE